MNAASTANNGPTTDLAAIQAAGGAWYGLTMTSRVQAEIQAVAAWIEAQGSSIPYIFMPQTSQGTTKSAAYNLGVTTDVGSVLKAAAYKRTAAWFHALDGEYLDDAITGDMLPLNPGSATWGLKQLVGLTPDSLTATEKANLDSRNMNYYFPLTSQASITKPGKMASGDWIDAIISIDWIKANVAAALANLLVTRPKIPFDDDGINQLASQVLGVLQTAEDPPYNMLTKNPKFTVTAPLASAISSANRTARILSPAITFAATLSGAIQDVVITGKVVE